MSMKIPRSEFSERVDNLRKLMIKEGISVCLVYGDEYRRENLRYISNYWPLFERGAAVIPLEGEPVVLAAPEGELVCREMSAWPDIKVIPDFTCVTVPDIIEYPQANYSDFKTVFASISMRQGIEKIGIAGLDAMSHSVFESIKDSLVAAEIVDANSLLHILRLTKSVHEINCLKEAARIADEGYRALMLEAAEGKTEYELEAAACNAAKKAGAEFIPFCLVSSGQRIETIIGRATDKIIKKGEMVLAALAVQYEGYISTVNFQIVVGEMSEEQKKLVDILVQGEDFALKHLKAGIRQGELVKAVKDFFRQKEASQYDLYPPLHGCGAAEAESPYPDENSVNLFKAGMTVNVDLSLFGHPGGSNRIEEGFIVQENGYEPMSRLVRELARQWKDKHHIDLYNI